MQRKRLVASVAIAPFLLYASAALAETTITDAKTTAAQTSDTNDDVRVTSTGSIKPASGSGPALEMDTSNDITNEGAIGWNNVDSVSGMQAAGGLTGDIANSGSISLLEDWPAADATEADVDPDSDGDPDIDFAKGENRYGIRVTPGVGVLNGSITNTGSITIEGMDSAGIWVQPGVSGTLLHRGSISVIGGTPYYEADGTTLYTGPSQASYGIRVQGAGVGGDLDVRGSVGVIGQDSVGVSVEGDVTGLFRVQGSVSARGYRSSTAPTTAAALAAIDADDLMQGGPAVQVKADVGGGILIDSARPADTDADAATPDNDEDDDGIPDAEEGAGGAISVFGSAPALLIGDSASDITVGAVGAGDDAYGLINLGSITAAGVYPDLLISVGVYEDHPATALQIGADAAGMDTVLAGGARNDGTITASAIDADATAVRLTQGAVLGTGGTGALVNNGVIGAQTTATSGFTAPSVVPGGGDPNNIPGVEEANTAYAISIEAGAQVSTLTNAGAITAIANGEHGSAVAIQDASGTLSTITNTSSIRAIITPTDDASDTDDDDFNPNNETITGTRTAIDVSASTTGVTITQSGINDGDDGDDGIADADADEDGVDDADEPLIYGDVFLGSGADTLNIQNGQLLGDIDFGGGDDALNITGGAVVQGQLLGTSAGDGLAVNVADGRLFVTDTNMVYGSSLSVGGDGQLIVAVDPDTDESTRFVVDTATFADGAQIGVTVRGLLTFDNLNDTKDFLIVDAGTLDAGDIDDTLLGQAPYLYVVGVNADEATGEVNLAIRRRLAEEAGFNAAQTAAYDAIYAALGEDDAVQTAILAQQDREGFLRLYNQLLPDQGEGVFSALDMAQLAISRAVATKPDLRRRYGPDSFWVQELNMQVKREGGETLGSDTKALGFVGGYEASMGDGGALGATLAYVTAEETDSAALVGEQTTVSELEGGLYWRQSAGAWLFSVRGGGGYAWFDGTRRFLDPNTALVREATSSWTGVTASAHAGVQYEKRFGRYYLRPGVHADYFYLSEGERDETGAGAIDLTVAKRTSSRLSGSAEIAFGAEFGREFWWRPEVRVGYRHTFSGTVGETTAAFAGGTPFTIAAMDPGEGAAIVAVALKMGTALSYLALEGEMEAAQDEQRYNVKLVGRVMF